MFPLSLSPTLFSGPGPVGLPPVPWTEKTTKNSPFFVRHGDHCCRGELIGRTAFCFFFSGLQKLEQQAKKFIEHRGEYVEYIPILIAVACFLPGRAKNLPATSRNPIGQLTFIFVTGSPYLSHTSIMCNSVSLGWGHEGK